MFLQPHQSKAALLKPTLSQGQGFRIRLLNGPSAGVEMPPTKVVTTIGKLGLSVVSVARKPYGYELTHVEGKVAATVNNVSVADSPIYLKNHESIELGGLQMEFLAG